jgi:hypothetical protein
LPNAENRERDDLKETDMKEAELKEARFSVKRQEKQARLRRLCPFIPYSRS